MFRWCIAIILFATIHLLFTRAARAEPPMLRIPILPSIVPPLPFSAVAAETGTDGHATLMPPDLAPVDHTFIGTVARMLDGLRGPRAGGPRDAASRNPTLRDPQRERDATSFGIQTPVPMSGKGAGFAAAGAALAAVQFLDLGGFTKNLPLSLSIGPCMFQGGGGIGIRGRF